MSQIEMQDDRPTGVICSPLVGGTDTFLSGWGKATGKPSYAFWCCENDSELFDRLRRWVESRNDIKRCRVVDRKYRPSRPCHCHVYFADRNHPAFE